MTRISFYNGLREIGGTFVAIETDKAVCIFDFGFAVSGRSDDRIIKRKEYAADYIRLGMLTPYDGIYDSDTAKLTGLKPYGETDKKCFFIISHMHIDHMGGLGSLAKEVPVYMSEESLKLYRCLEQNHDVQDAGHENCIGIPFGESFTVEDISVKVLPVDHDVIGASGFMIETPDGSVCYTGDYRFHGFHPEVTKAFAEACRGADVMITEGVTASFDDLDMISLTEPTETMRTEETLQQEMLELAEECDKLVIINPYNRNVERIHRLIDTYAQCGRTLVMDASQALYVSGLYPTDKISVFEETIHQKHCDTSWKVVSRTELLANPQKYVLQLDYADLFQLFDLKDAVSAYVHMDGAPLGDYDPSFQKLKNILEALEINYIFKSLGGHAKPYYLRKVIDTISPKTLIPLHSFRPEQVNSANIERRILPEYGETVVLDNHKIIN